MTTARLAPHAALAVLCLLVAACRPGGAPASAPPPAAEVPARRIVTLAPHLAELVFAAGAGDRLVGVVEFSDFPPAVARLPRVGDAFRVDAEAVLALEPDLVIGWTSGNPPPVIERLRALGLRVVTVEPVALADVAAHVEQIGVLAGTPGAAAGAAAAYRSRLAALEQAAAGQAPLSVFVQLAARPYYTVTDRHFLGQAVSLCGGRNVFGSLAGLTAVVSVESVIEARPQVIVASDMGGSGPSPLAEWGAWPGLPAVAAGNTFVIDADLLSRPSGRILDGVEEICGVLRTARGRGAGSSG